MLRNAALAMYHAKIVGGLQIEVYTKALAHTMQKQEIAAGLREALRNGELRLNYQPQGHPST